MHDQLEFASTARGQIFMGNLCQGVWCSPLQHSSAFLITCMRRGCRAQGRGSGDANGGRVLLAKQKPRELYGYSGLAVVSGRGL